MNAITQEDKELLLKDLSARLSYGVMCDCLHDYRVKVSAVDAEDLTVYYSSCDEWEPIEYCRPYLRSMSSMTKEEEKELGNFVAAIMFASQSKNPLFQLTKEALLVDFFNKHHFDYRGLIEKGIVLAAPKGMYKEE